MKGNLAEIQPKNNQNVQKTHFLQKVPGVSGLKCHSAIYQLEKGKLTVTWLAQLVEHQSAVREVEGSNPKLDQHSVSGS